MAARLPRPEHIHQTTRNRSPLLSRRKWTRTWTCYLELSNNWMGHPTLRGQMICDDFSRRGLFHKIQFLFRFDRFPIESSCSLSSLVPSQDKERASDALQKNKLKTACNVVENDTLAVVSGFPRWAGGSVADCLPRRRSRPPRCHRQAPRIIPCEAGRQRRARQSARRPPTDQPMVRTETTIWRARRQRTLEE